MTSAMQAARVCCDCVMSMDSRETFRGARGEVVMSSVVYGIGERGGLPRGKASRVVLQASACRAALGGQRCQGRPYMLTAKAQENDTETEAADKVVENGSSRSKLTGIGDQGP